MSIQSIEQEYKQRYPAFKLHNMRFWENSEGFFCQAFNELSQLLYGNLFKLDVKNFEYTKVKNS